MIEYTKYLKRLDLILAEYFTKHAEYICCKAGCSNCCKKGDYPMSQIELEYLMQGYINAPDDVKQQIQKNVDEMQKGEACPFLINDLCSVYEYRPIVCRIHGLAYLINKTTMKLPECANEGKNYSKIYRNGEVVLFNPIKDDLDKMNKKFGEIKNLYDWLKG